MARPRLDSVDFPTLHSGMGRDSFGTVTGTSFKERDTVDIVGRGAGNKQWQGTVTSRVSGNTWNATVSRLSASSAYAETAKAAGPIITPDATETVDVTVTNTDGTSNKVGADSDVVP